MISILVKEARLSEINKPTFMETIGCGMPFMLFFNHPSRLLAKLRMAWVKAPVTVKVQ